MDVTDQVYETEATGWLAGLYDDIRRTFRAPIVNWIFRTAAANHPRFLRYAWGQVKPIFQTRAFGNCSIRYRDAVLSQVELSDSRRTELDVSPAEYRELRGQLARFDIVAPRLAVLFETVDRGLGGDLAPQPDDSTASTAPLPPRLDRNRGRSPTLADPPYSPDLQDTLAEVRDVHGLGETLPSIYRCLGQWPGVLRATWPAIQDSLKALDTAAVHEVVETFVDELAYYPRLTPSDLTAAGIDSHAVEDLQALFGAFNQGPDQTVLPAIHLHAGTVNVAGRRAFA